MKNNHKGKDCPNEKCHICKKKIHKTPFCPLQNKIHNNYKIKKKVPNCTKCSNNGHKANECLIRPNDIFIFNRNNAPLCRICNSSEHYLCPFKNEVYIGNLVQGKTTYVSYKNHKKKSVSKNEWCRIENTI